MTDAKPTDPRLYQFAERDNRVCGVEFRPYRPDPERVAQIREQAIAWHGARIEPTSESWTERLARWADQHPLELFLIAFSWIVTAAAVLVALSA